MLIPNKVKVNGDIIIWKFSIIKSAGSPCTATVTVPTFPGLTFQSITSSKAGIVYSNPTISWPATFVSGENVEVNITYLVTNISLIPSELEATVAFVCDTNSFNNVLTETLEVEFCPPSAGAVDDTGCSCGTVANNDTVCSSCTTQYRIVTGSEVNVIISSFNSETGNYTLNYIDPTLDGSFEYRIWCVNCADGNDYDVSGATVTISKLFTEYMSGYQGYQGPQGVEGPQGFQGYQGAQGGDGVQGTQGLRGYQGFQGYQGYQGIAGTPGGAQGAQGAQGPADGAQGAQGSQGATGAQGTTGSQGLQGSQGAQGTQGSQGAQGTQGTQGNQGSSGTQGNQGTTGNQGATGAQGNTGAQGFQGNQGTQGNQGNQGNQGTQGVQGPGYTVLAYERNLVGSTTTIVNVAATTNYFVVPSTLNGKTLSKIGGIINNVASGADTTTVTLYKNTISMLMNVVLTGSHHNSATANSFVVSTGDIIDFNITATSGTPKGLSIYLEFNV